MPTAATRHGHVTGVSFNLPAAFAVVFALSAVIVVAVVLARRR
jgi:hypothetical protein